MICVAELKLGKGCSLFWSGALRMMQQTGAALVPGRHSMTSCAGHGYQRCCTRHFMQDARCYDASDMALYCTQRLRWPALTIRMFEGSRP